MARIKKVLVLRDYVEITNHQELLDFINQCISKGLLAALFMNPNILTAFYTSGSTAAAALLLAINNYKASPIKANLDIVEAKMALVVIWLDSYSDQVETISNAPANRTTREEAGANIELAGLQHQALTATKKGTPVTPTFTAKNTGGGGNAEIEVTNGKTVKPNLTHFILVEIPVGTDPVTHEPILPAVVSLRANGQISVSCTVPVRVETIAMAGKGKITKISHLATGISYNVYGITKNGKTLISALSAAVLLKM